MDDQQNKKRFKFKPISLVYLLLFAVFVYLVIYHGPHLWTILPLFIIFLCPLMHMNHHGHGGHGEHKDSDVEHRREAMKKDLENKDNDKHKGCH